MPEQHSFRLADGRNLDFLEFGNPIGYPVLYFHGIPASGSEALLVQHGLEQAGLRIVAIDRPGVGRSDFLAGRSFSDWPEDVVSLADHLGLGRFAILGNSGGAAYVLACTIQIPERLTNAVIVSGAWQMNQPEAVQYMYKVNRLFWEVASNLTFLLPPMLRGTRISPKVKNEELLARFRRTMHPKDFSIIAEADRLQIAKRTKNTGLQQLKGAAHEFRLYAKPNGLEFREIQKKISFFHGGLDKIVPVELVMKMVKRIPGHEMTIYPEETHLSTFCNRIDDVIAALTVGRDENMSTRS